MSSCLWQSSAAHPYGTGQSPGQRQGPWRTRQCHQSRRARWTPNLPTGAETGREALDTLEMQTLQAGVVGLTPLASSHAVRVLLLTTHWRTQALRGFPSDTGGSATSPASPALQDLPGLAVPVPSAAQEATSCCERAGHRPAPEFKRSPLNGLSPFLRV